MDADECESRSTAIVLEFKGLVREAIPWNRVQFSILFIHFSRYHKEVGDAERR